MQLNSFPYIFLFLPISIAGFFLAQRISVSLAKGWLLLSALVFYATQSPKYLPLLLGSILLNFFVSRAFRNAPDSRRVLLTGIIGNLVILCVFKYAHFLVDNCNLLLGTHFHIPAMSFPAGVSFFTIQQIMYLVDRSEGLVDHLNLFDHAIFVAFFPYVLMGPIVRAGQVMPQLAKSFAARWNTENASRAVFIFLIGLFKKVVLADTFGRWANLGFGYPDRLAFLDAWLAAIAFAFQLYFDFSGYCDMAVGSALLINVQLPQNFDAPFRAQGIIEFWRRWHITLTDFITTYLYTPMVRSFRKLTFWKAMMATLLAMTIAGLWHGAAWTYVVFGLLHGAALVLNNYVRRRKKVPSPLVSRIATGLFLIFAFVVFRAPDLARAGSILHSMVLPARLFDPSPYDVIDSTDRIVGAAWMLFGVVISVAGPSSTDLQTRFTPNRRMLAFATVTALFAILYMNSMVSLGFVYRDF